MKKTFFLRLAGNRWELTETDHPMPSAAFATKNEAIDTVLKFLFETPGSLQVQRGDGTVEEEWLCS